MPRGTTKRVPNRQRRAMARIVQEQQLSTLEAGLGIAELVRYNELLDEEGRPPSTTERLAILDRAKEYVAAADLAEREEH